MTKVCNPVKLIFQPSQLQGAVSLTQQSLMNQNSFVNSFWISSIKLFLTIDTTLLFGSFVLIDYTNLKLHWLLPVAWVMLLIAILCWLLGTFGSIVFFRQKLDEGQMKLRMMCAGLKNKQAVEIEEENFFTYSSINGFVVGTLFSFMGIISLTGGLAISLYPNLEITFRLAWGALCIITLVWLLVQYKNIQKTSDKSKQIKI